MLEIHTVLLTYIDEDGNTNDVAWHYDNPEAAQARLDATKKIITMMGQEDRVLALRSLSGPVQSEFDSSEIDRTFNQAEEILEQAEERVQLKKKAGESS